MPQDASSHLSLEHVAGIYVRTSLFIVKTLRTSFVKDCEQRVRSPAAIAELLKRDHSDRPNAAASKMYGHRGELRPADAQFLSPLLFEVQTSPAV